MLYLFSTHVNSKMKFHLCEKMLKYLWKMKVEKIKGIRYLSYTYRISESAFLFGREIFLRINFLKIMWGREGEGERGGVRRKGRREGGREREESWNGTCPFGTPVLFAILEINGRAHERWDVGQDIISIWFPVPITNAEDFSYGGKWHPRVIFVLSFSSVRHDFRCNTMAI